MVSTSESIPTENVETDEPDMNEVETPSPGSQGHESLAEWSREDSFLRSAITTGKNGPHWHLVRKRIIVDRETDEVVREDLIDHNRKRSLLSSAIARTCAAHPNHFSVFTTGASEPANKLNV